MKKVEIVSKELGIPVDSINRYVRERKLIRNGVVIAELVEGKDFGKNADGNRIVKAESIQAYRKLKKPTGRPCKPKSDFKLDWGLLTKNVLAKYGTMAEFFDKCKMKHHRFYFIKNGETNPTKAEQKILRKEI